MLNDDDLQRQLLYIARKTVACNLHLELFATQFLASANYNVVQRSILSLPDVRTQRVGLQCTHFCAAKWDQCSAILCRGASSENSV